MNSKLIIVGIAAVAALTSVNGAESSAPELRGSSPSIRPGDGKTYKEVSAPIESPCLFRDNELQFDVFGLGTFYKGASGNQNSYVQNSTIDAINTTFPGANLAGVGSFNDRQFSGRPGWGGGLGINYIFARYFGIGIEQSVFGRNSGNAKNAGEGLFNDPNYDVGNYGYTRWQTTANLILRYPICQWNLAPYLLVGGGAMYGNVPNINYGQAVNDGVVAQGGPNLGVRNRYRMAGQGFGHVGGGLEYRVTENIGLFSDLRYLFSNVSGLPNNQMQWRYGVRLAF
jgi:hypothetical protein